MISSFFVFTLIKCFEKKKIQRELRNTNFQQYAEV